MTTNFPSSIDNFTNPTSSSTMASPSHSAQHADVNDAVEAIETALLDGAPLFVDDANERVGIGTTTPDRALTVDSTETNIANFKGSNATGAISFMGSGTTSNTQVRIGAIGDGMKLIAGDTERIRIDSSGNVGINDTTPSYKLDVNGDINATGAVRIGGNGIGEYQSYSPTTGGLTVGNGTMNASYCRIGKMIHYVGYFYLGTTSSISPYVDFSLPVTNYSSTFTQPSGDATFWDQGGNLWKGATLMIGQTAFRFVAEQVDSNQIRYKDLTSAVPFVWGNGDHLFWNFVYRGV